MQLPEDVLSFLTMFTVRARSYPKVKRIVLYGSYAQNCWNQESDIDIAVFIKKEMRRISERSISSSLLSVMITP